MLQPENVQIATLDEHFAVDSHPGDVVLLGNTSWRVQRIDPQGKVLVEDAHGAPPSIPFWEGEAPQRTAELCDGVSELRAEIDRRTSNVKPSAMTRSSGAEEDVSVSPYRDERWGALHPEARDCMAWLCRECFRVRIRCTAADHVHRCGAQCAGRCAHQADHHRGALLR